MANDDTTHFGFETVPGAQKAARVASVFDSVADRYDVMNDLMSAGMHRVWKRFAVTCCGLRPGMQVLDLAGGTGDMAALALPVVGASGAVVVSDINPNMLARGRERLIDRGHVGNVDFTLADAEQLPFADRSFDCVIMAFGLRNVTRKGKALRSIHRVLRRGGRVVVLEFSELAIPAARGLYDWYSFKVLPRLGRLVANDEESYRYLAESIRMHPNQETLLQMMEAAGFRQSRYINMTGGVVAVHRGYRIA